MPSNFTSSTPNSAFWVVTGPSGQPVTVSGTGGAFVGNLQALLKLLLVTPRPTYDGTMVRASDIAIDKNWGPMTTKGLWAVTGSADLRDIIRIAASIGSGSVPRDVVQIAANLISAQFGRNAQVPADAITPRYRAVSPGTIAPFTSRPSTAAEIASVGANPSTLPPDTGVPPAPPAPTPTPDTSGGGSKTPGTSGGSQTPGGPTGVPVVRTAGSSISWGAVAAVAAGVVVLGVIAASVRGDQKGHGTRTARTARTTRRLSRARA